MVYSAARSNCLTNQVAFPTNMARLFALNALVPLLFSAAILAGCANSSHKLDNSVVAVQAPPDPSAGCTTIAGAWFQSTYHQPPGPVTAKNRFGGTDTYALSAHYSQISSKCYARVEFNSTAGRFGMFKSIEYEQLADGESGVKVGEYTALLGSDIPSRCVWEGQPCETQIDELAANEDVGMPFTPVVRPPAPTYPPLSFRLEAPAGKALPKPILDRALTWLSKGRDPILDVEVCGFPMKDEGRLEQAVLDRRRSVAEHGFPFATSFFVTCPDRGSGLDQERFVILISGPDDLDSSVHLVCDKKNVCTEARR